MQRYYIRQNGLSLGKAMGKNRIVDKGNTKKRVETSAEGVSPRTDLDKKVQERGQNAKI